MTSWSRVQKVNRRLRLEPSHRDFVTFTTPFPRPIPCFARFPHDLAYVAFPALFVIHAHATTLDAARGQPGLLKR